MSDEANLSFHMMGLDVWDRLDSPKETIDGALAELSRLETLAIRARVERWIDPLCLRSPVLNALRDHWDGLD
jgi:hypothetical protein